jgi:hypothetical protein
VRLNPPVHLAGLINWALGIFDDAFIDYLFDLVEQTRQMQDETFNYSVIKLIVSKNNPANSGN